MDRKIPASAIKKRRKKKLILGAIAILAIFSIYLLGFSDNAKEIDSDKILIATVEESVFDDVLNVQGRIEPMKSFLLDAVEGGTVEEIYAEAGTMVEAGQPLLKLSNTALMLDFMNRETQIVEQINNLRNTRMQMELNERNILQQVLDISYEMEQMKRQFAIDTSLYVSDVIARKEYEDSRARYQYLEKKHRLLSHSYQKDQTYRNIQLERIDESIEMMERNLRAIRRNLQNLTVRAPISGQLTTLNAETGQGKVRGENIGRIDQLDSFLIRANIDEHYLRRVSIGQQATYRAGQEEYQLVVSRVYPEVSNNQFEMELSFSGDIPPGIRRGQTMGIKLSLGNPVQAILVPRGAFYSSTGGRWMFVMNKKGYAQRREVKLGRQNPDYIEVLGGLQQGEKVIISSYDTYLDFEELLIN